LNNNWKTAPFDLLLQQIDNLTWDQEQQILDRITANGNRVDPYGSIAKQKRAEMDYNRYLKAELEGKPIAISHYEVVHGDGTRYDVFYDGWGVTYKKYNKAGELQYTAWDKSAAEFECNVLGQLDTQFLDDGNIVVCDIETGEIYPDREPWIRSFKVFYGENEPKEKYPKIWTWKGSG
jgi:hypothetical protein